MKGNNSICNVCNNTHVTTHIEEKKCKICNGKSSILKKNKLIPCTNDQCEKGKIRTYITKKCTECVINNKDFNFNKSLNFDKEFEFGKDYDFEIKFDFNNDKSHTIKKDIYYDKNLNKKFDFGDRDFKFNNENLKHENDFSFGNDYSTFGVNNDSFMLKNKGFKFGNKNNKKIDFNF